MTTRGVHAPSGRDVAIALSLANLSCMRLWLEILGVTSKEAYFLDVANVDVLALVTNVLLLAALFLWGATVARRRGRRGRQLMVAGFVAVLLLRLNGLGPALAPGIFTVVDSWRNAKYLDALLPLLLLGGLAAAVARWPQRALRLAVGFVLILTPFVAVTFARAAWILLVLDPTEALAAKSRPFGTPVREVPGPRVVVIVMDALSRYHAVDARPDDLELPAFDRLRAESIDASQVTQIGWVTKVSLPAMLTGLPVVDSDPSSANDLLLQLADGTERSWSATSNVLGDAQRLGGVAVLAGWYHPYCRLFPNLDACSTFPTRTVGSRGRETGFLHALLDQQLALVPYVNLRIRQVDIVEEQRLDAVEAVTLGQRGLVFLHMIVPHTPWIWDDEDDDFTVTRFDDDGYYGNIALMDAILGDLRRAMERAGKWDSTAVLLLSDHVMRYRPDYLDEPRDTRVPFLLKLPGGTQGVEYSRPFNALVTHDLVQALLRGELQSVEDATRWLDTRAVPSSAAPLQ
jgi:hypothetical protein